MVTLLLNNHLWYFLRYTHRLPFPQLPSDAALDSASRSQKQRVCFVCPLGLCAESALRLPHNHLRIRTSCVTLYAFLDLPISDGHISSVGCSIIRPGSECVPHCRSRVLSNRSSPDANLMKLEGWVVDWAATFCHFPQRRHFL